MGGDTPSFMAKKIQDGADFDLYIFRGNSSDHHNFLSQHDGRFSRRSLLQ